MTQAPRADRSPFALDLRAVGLFRVLLALTILLDQALLLPDWRAFLSPAALPSLADSRAADPHCCGRSTG